MLCIHATQSITALKTTFLSASSLSTHQFLHAGKLEYGGLLVKTMSTDHRIEPEGAEFTVIDPWGE